MTSDENGSRGPSGHALQADLESIYERYSGRISSFMSVRFANRETARDLTQEVFTRLLKTLASKPEIPKDISSYLYGIARHVVADHLAGKKRTIVGEDENTLANLPDALGLSPFETFRLKTCLKRLKEIDQAIITFHFWVGENHKEIARRIEMTHEQVRQRYRRALKRLKDCLKNRSGPRPVSGEVQTVNDNG